MNRIFERFALPVSLVLLIPSFGAGQELTTSSTVEVTTTSAVAEAYLHQELTTLGKVDMAADNTTSALEAFPELATVSTNILEEYSTYTKALESTLRLTEPLDTVTSDELLLRTDELLLEVDSLTTGDVQMGRGVTLKQALTIALQNNTSLKIQYLSPQQREWGIVGAWGAFDPVFRASASASHSRTTTRNEDSIAGTNEDTSSHGFSNSVSAGISGSLPTGTDYSLSTGFDRSATNDAMAWYGGSTNFSLTQSLLKGAGTEVNLVGVRTAENSYISSLYQLQNDLTSLVTNVQRAYWNLAIGIRSLEIQRINYELSRQRTERTMELVRVGRTSSLDLFSARAEMAASVTSLISSASEVKQLEITLKRLLNPEAFPDGWETQFFPLDEPNFTGEEINLKERIDLAMRLRPDLKQSLLDYENSCLTVIRTENGLLPSLDFSVNAGIGGDGNSFGRMFGSNTEPDRFNWGVGLEFSRSLHNRSAIASYSQSQLSKTAAMESINNMRQVIQVDVRSAVISITGAQAARESTRVTREQRQKEYEAEVAKLEQNRSTQLAVNQVQRDMTQAALDELRAQITLITSYLSLYAAEGTTLQRVGLKPTQVKRNMVTSTSSTKTSNGSRGSKQ